MGQTLLFLFEICSKSSFYPIWLLENCPAIVDQVGNLSMFLR